MTAIVCVLRMDFDAIDVGFYPQCTCMRTDRAAQYRDRQAKGRIVVDMARRHESITIGAHPFVRQAGAHAIEVRVRDIPDDSVRANYAWIVYDFSGRLLDSSTF